MSPINPFEPPTPSPPEAKVPLPAAQVAQGVLLASLAWTPAVLISSAGTAFVVRSLNPEAVFYVGLVILFWMCVYGTVTMLLAGFLYVLPINIWMRRHETSPFFVNVALALLHVWVMPTLILSITYGRIVMAHGLSLWCIIPALTCCLVFHVHQCRAQRLMCDVRASSELP